MSSYFYNQVRKNSSNADFIEKLERFAEDQKQLIYVVDRPLGDTKYVYDYSDALVVLSPKSKITFVNFGKYEDEFEDYIDDVTEDIGSISDKYNYKNVIGRPRTWQELVEADLNDRDLSNITKLFGKIRIESPRDQKRIDLLISLFIGSINDIKVVKETIPETMLDKVKQKIQLFDGDQTRFIYQKPEKKRIRIQGLSGTGKTELLLHKLREVYLSEKESVVFFTCFNKILAENLRQRIPAFFNFMKVEQQIEWERRLWCKSSWGSNAAPNSGAYRYICWFYKIPFYHLAQMTFDKACKLAIQEINEIKRQGRFKYAFDYMFIDESQDFTEEFFDLCDVVSSKNIYIAGDIFQNIFDSRFSDTITPDYLLGKCYRTDPKTLMFAHALGMGLFDQKKLRWLEPKEWKDCGYNVEEKGSKLILSREPIRRFEDVDDNYSSIQIIATTDSLADSVIVAMNQIISENPTATEDDIGIILVDSTNDIYSFADLLESRIYRNFKFRVNKAYETKERISGQVFVSNRNNVKGLEFPFVICVTKKISDASGYRNSLYTMLSRSFIKSYLVIFDSRESGLSPNIIKGLEEISMHKRMVIEQPSAEEKERIRTQFKYEAKELSHYDIMMKIFDSLEVADEYREKLMIASEDLEVTGLDEKKLFAFVKSTLQFIKKEE